MYHVTSITVDTDEDGFSLVIDGYTDRPYDDGYTSTEYRFNVQDHAEQLYDEVTGMIGPWLAEKEAAKRTRPIGDTEEPFYVGVPDLRDHAFRTAEIVASLYDQEKDR